MTDVLKAIIILLPITLVGQISPPVQDHFILYGRTVVDIDDYDSLTVEITNSKNASMTQLLTDSGKFELQFPIGFVYTVTFSRPKYVQKIIQVDTRVKEKDPLDSFQPYQCQLVLHKTDIKEFAKLYQKPIYFIRFDNNLQDFKWTEDEILKREFKKRKNRKIAKETIFNN